MAQTSLFFLFCHLSNGFLTATRPVKPAAWSLLFTVETETSLLRSVLSCAWSYCPVSLRSRKLLTLRNLSSDCVVALCLPDLLLSEFPPVSKCLLMVSETLLTDTLACFTISLKERPSLLRVIMVCLSSFVNCLFLAIMRAIYYFLQCNSVQMMLQRVQQHSLFQHCFYTDRGFVTNQQKLGHL